MATEPRLIKPLPWFVIKTRLLDAAPNGSKIFLNVCTEDAIPAPPEATDDTLGRIIAAENVKDLENYFIPIVLSDLRDEKDKAGSPCKVCDCVVHPSVREITERLPDYRTLLIAIILDQADSYYNWNLSREITIPNMQSKGKLKERTAQLPLQTEPIPETPRYRQELVSISGEELVSIVLSVPKLNKTILSRSALDVESKRIILDCRPPYTLDIVLDMAPKGINVDKATAKWLVQQQQLVIQAPLLK